MKDNSLFSIILLKVIYPESQRLKEPFPNYHKGIFFFTKKIYIYNFLSVVLGVYTLLVFHASVLLCVF